MRDILMSGHKWIDIFSYLDMCKEKIAMLIVASSHQNDIYVY